MKASSIIPRLCRSNEAILPLVFLGLLPGATVRIGAAQKGLAWPLRLDDTQIETCTISPSVFSHVGTRKGRHPGIGAKQRILARPLRKDLWIGASVETVMIQRRLT